MSATKAASRRTFPRPRLRSTSACKAIERAGYKPGDDVALALDPAASEFFEDGKYVYKGEGKTRSIEEQVDYLIELVGAYPIVSIEDGMAEQDWAGWKPLTTRLG